MNINEALEEEMKENKFENDFEEWHHNKYGVIFGEIRDSNEERIYDDRIREFKKYCQALLDEII